MEKARSELNTEVRQMTAQIERSREKLSRSRNERESNASQRELEELRKLQRDREDEIERLNTGADQARTTIDDAETKRANLARELEGTTQGTTQTIAELTKERAGRAKQREGVVA